MIRIPSQIYVIASIASIALGVSGWLGFQDQCKKIAMLRASRDSLQARCKRATAEVEAARIDAEIQLHMDSLFWRDSLQAVRDSFTQHR